jgi:hypothetical protein
VFPNPVRKNAQLVVNVKEADANGQLMIYNQAGILVRNQKIQLAAGASFVSLDNLEAGPRVYIS